MLTVFMIDTGITFELRRNRFFKNLLSQGSNSELLHGEGWSKDADGIVGALRELREFVTTTGKREQNSRFRAENSTRYVNV